MDENHPMTKKDLKSLRRLENLNKAKNESRQGMVKWIIIAVSSIIFVALFIFLVFSVKENNSQVSETATLSDAGWVRGVSDAKVTLVEFGDLQCPACRAYHPVVKEVLSSYEEGEVKLVFKHFPLTSIHPNALPAALAAEAAGAQEKFFEYHDILYERQEEWANLARIDAEAIFFAYAEELALDIEKFKTDYENEIGRENIDSQVNEGVTNGVNGTPTFFVNNKRISNPQGTNGFREIIDAELSSQKSN